jgi:uncharacterized protein YeaO (DUF488 family)
VKRACERAARADGTRFLIDRLWPRGLSKAAPPPMPGSKTWAPSAALRRWFSHDPRRWNEFRKRYARELDSSPDAWRPIVSAARRGTVTLVYSAHDVRHNNAVALLEYLTAKRRKSPA